MRQSKDRVPLFYKACFFFVALHPFVPVFANPPYSAAIDAQEQTRHQEREREFQQQIAPKTDIRLSRPTVSLPDYPSDETPCITINNIRLQGESSHRFQWALKAANSAKGRCLGAQGIQLAINKVQNAILEQGYVTTRVLAHEQDLSQGVLTLALVPGRIAKISFKQPVSYRARLCNAMPAATGDILNLRDIEQALENLTNVYNARATFKILPGEQEATSDVLIDWSEGRPFRLTFGLDNEGSEGTGKYQGTTILAIDAPFAHNDLFYAKVDRSLFRRGPYDRRSNTFNYVIPIGYWRFTANYNNLDYYQNTAKDKTKPVIYSGKTDNYQFAVSRLIFRNQAHKTSLKLSLSRNHLTNAVGGKNLDNNHRRTLGWELGVNQISYFGKSTLNANMSWRQGTGAFGALSAPKDKEKDHQENSHAGVALADISLNLPLDNVGGPWRYYTSLRGQWSDQRLTPQERLGIAGRYTVRGFDGEETLRGDKGLLWRNELAWNVSSRGHELYWGVDYGRVTGPSTRTLAGQQLAGTALGLRGSLWGHVSYDFFAGKPLVRPSKFPTSKLTSGFSINLQL